jgi:hypothetical protein
MGGMCQLISQPLKNVLIARITRKLGDIPVGVGAR